MSASPYVRRATTPVLVAAALISGAILLLGDRFEPVPGYALARLARIDEQHIAACVAEESMRLIDSDREQCEPSELTLVAAPGRESSAVAARCPALR
jgi:hypothetical protein